MFKIVQFVNDLLQLKILYVILSSVSVKLITASNILKLPIDINHFIWYPEIQF